jgi:hypothetical protein
MNTPSPRPAALPLLAATLLLLAGPLAAADIALPAPRGADLAITRILAARRETAAFSPAGLSAQAVSDVLWAACGVNRPATGNRTANYSWTSRDTEIYLLCAEGVFVYEQLEHQLTLRSSVDIRATLGAPASAAPLTLVLATNSTKIDDFYGSIHTGFVAENIGVACADRGLGAHLSAGIPPALTTALALDAGHNIRLLQTLGYPDGATAPEPVWAVAAGALTPAAVNDAPALRILKRRRSTRSFGDTPFTTQTTADANQILADLVWSGLGINNPTTGELTSPLVAGTQDIDLYLALASGVYLYRPGTGAAHHLDQISSADLRGSFGYASVPAIFIYVSDLTKLSGSSTEKTRAACLHAGIVSQNVTAFATAEGLGELVRTSAPGTLAADLHLTSTQIVLFNQTLGNMAAAPGAAAVAVGAGSGGTVTGAPRQTIAFGAVGTPVTAVPDAGYTFAYWSGLPGGRATANPLALPNVTCAMNLAAVFAPEPATYAAWRAVSFAGSALANDSVSGPDADPDAAGVTNLQRYAFGLAARGRVAAPTTLGSSEAGGRKFLTISFGRRATGTGLSYIVEGSGDLHAWSTVRTYAPGSTTPIIAEDTEPMGPAGPARRFLRVRVVTSP